ncbi:MAG: GNAT family N-acetyltransferase [Ruminococcus sp.]|nr:GNAT family N-acetyltransferase [Ruminococcus sp.]
MSTPIISDALIGDLPEILRLQYLAYQSEAELCGTRDIPPLKQTLEELQAEFESGLILKLTDESGSIIGSVRASKQEGTVKIGKLMVHPDHRCKGYGSMLLKEIESRFPGCWYELFTSTKSADNLRLYRSLGYCEFRRKTVDREHDLRFVYLQKSIPGGAFRDGIVKFRCGCCGSKVDMSKSVPSGFEGWAYTCERVEWLGKGLPLPPLDENNFQRLTRVPRKHERLCMRACMGFCQQLGSEFYMEYLNPELYLSFEGSDRIYRSCAIVRCRLDRVLTATEYSAWVEVTVLDVIGFAELPERYPPTKAEHTLEELLDYPQKSCDNYIDYDDEGWKDLSWSAQGDVGTGGIIRRDIYGQRHLIIESFFSFHDDITYFGNIVSTKEQET